MHLLHLFFIGGLFLINSDCLIKDSSIDLADHCKTLKGTKKAPDK